MTMVFEFFPPEYLLLQKELDTDYHPTLQKILRESGGGADDVDLKLAQIAAYCEVMLDGIYTLDERVNLCRLLWEKLQLKRVNPNAGLIIIQ